MKILTVTNLFPGEDLPQHGQFVEERLRQITSDGDFSAEVVALRPGLTGQLRQEVRNGVTVNYLPVPTLPKITNWIDPWLWARPVCAWIAQLDTAERAEIVLDGHFLYPDGATVALVGARLGLPIVLTARGSDVNVKLASFIVRYWTRWAVNKSHAVLTVSDDLRRKLIGYGIDERKVTALRNGVDLDKFSPAKDSVARRADDSVSLLSVGHLAEGKGHHLVIDALAQLPNAELTVVGSGPDKEKLRARARRAGLDKRVRFAGQINQEELVAYYRRADVTILASAREGMPNVLLESLACGTRVVATDVGGISEIVKSSTAGIVVQRRDVRSICDALRKLQEQPISRAETRRYAVENLDWAPIIRAQRDIYREAVAH